MTKLKIPGPEVGYTDILDYEIEQQVKEDASKPLYFPLRPSSAGYCSRRLGYDLMQYRGHAKYEKELIPPNVYRLLNLGHSIEYSVIKNFQLLKGLDIKYKQQRVTLFKLDPIKKKEQEIIEGAIDLVLWSDKYKCVMDVKSAKDAFSKAFNTRWTETLDKFDKTKSLIKLSDTAWYAEDLEAFLKELKGDFLADNLHQLNAYCCTEFFQERGIDHGVILKYNKNDSRQYELRFKPSLKVFKQLQDKYNMINKAVSQKRVEDIPKDNMLGSMKCAFCPYSKQCWGDKDSTKEWFKTFPKKAWPTDTSRLKDDKQVLEQLFVSRANKEKDLETLSEVDQKIIEILNKSKVNKVRLENGEVYEMKYLKSPRPHFEIRRSKA